MGRQYSHYTLSLWAKFIENLYLFFPIACPWHYDYEQMNSNQGIMYSVVHWFQKGMDVLGYGEIY